MAYIQLLFLLFTLNIITPVTAAPNVYYSVKPDRGPQSTDFLVQVSISGNSFENSSYPVFEENEEMSLNYVSSSVQQQIINGTVSFQKTFIFKIEFKKVLPSGDTILPRGSIEINGTKFRFPTRKLTIEAENSAQGSQSKNLNSKLLPSKDGFQFIQTVSNENPYIGEQILYRVEIIAPTNLEKAQLEEFEPQGIWRERYGADEKKIRVVQNTSINSFSESWFPVQSGNLEVPERILMAAVREMQKRRVPTGSSLGDQFFGSLLSHLTQFKTIEKQLNAPPIRLEVKPLPQPKTPIKGFIPVGQIKVTSSINTNNQNNSESVSIGEPITLTIQVSGDANLRPLEIFNPDNLDSREFKRYDEKPILSRTIGESNVIFYKTFNISLIPLKSGFRKLPSFKIDWFNPTKGIYESYSTEEKSVLVQGEDITNENDVNEKYSDDKLRTDEIKDNQEIKYDLESYKYSRSQFHRLFTVKIAAFVFLVTVLNIFLSFLKRFPIRSKFLKKKQINLATRNLIKEISKNTSLQNIIELFKELLTLKYGGNFTSLTPTEIYSSLKGKVDEKTLEELISILKATETHILSGDSSNNIDTLAKLEHILKKL